MAKIAKLNDITSFPSISFCNYRYPFNQVIHPLAFIGARCQNNPTEDIFMKPRVMNATCHNLIQARCSATNINKADANELVTF